MDLMISRLEQVTWRVLASHFKLYATNLDPSNYTKMKLVFKKLEVTNGTLALKGIKIFRLETKLTDIVTLSNFNVKFSLGLSYNCHPGREVCCVHRR